MEGPPPGERRFLLVCALALAAVVAFLLRDSLLGGKVLSQVDHLLAFPPWQEVAPPGHVPGNPLLEDQALLMVPWLEFAAGELRQGRLPLWNPYNYGGQPIHAANSGSFLWPLHLLYYAFPGHGYYAWSALLRLTLAGVFAVLYLRRLGVSRAAALPGAVAFSLCGFLVAWLNHPHSNVALTLPLHLFLIERLAARPRWRDGGWLALAVGAQLLGGHLQTSLHLFLVLGLYVGLRCLAGTPRLGPRGLAVGAAGTLLGGLLAAPQLVPMVEYLSESRGVTVLEQQEQTDELDALAAAVVQVAPDVHGGPHTGDYRGPEGRNLNYSEIIGGYVGRLALILAACAVFLRWREARVRFWGAMVLGCALVAWQVWPLHDAFRAIPRVRSTNPTRLLLYVAFGLSVLAALGLDGILARLRWTGGRAVAAGAAAFLVVTGELVSWGRGYNPEVDAGLIFPPTPTTEYLMARADEGEPLRVLAVERTTLRAAANLHYRLPMLTGYDKIEFAPWVELVELLSNDPGDTFISEIPLFDRQEALPLASLLNVEYLVATQPLPPPLEPAFTSPGGVAVYRNPSVLPRAFAAREVEVVPNPAERLARLGSADCDPYVALLEEPVDGLEDLRTAGGDLGQGPVRIVRHEPREVELASDLDGPGLVVLSDTWHPGWRAWIDGELAPVLRVDHALRGISVGAGPRSIVLRYVPGSWRLGALLGALSALVVAGLILRGAGCGQESAADGRC